MIKKLTVCLYIAGTLMIATTLWRMVGLGDSSSAQVNTTEKSYATGWNQKDGSWNYFGNDGHKITGWIKDGENFYYLKDDGSMSVGKVQIKDTMYEFDQKGVLISDSISDETTLPSSVSPTKEKLEAASKYSWFEENGNTYFKGEKSCKAGGANIDGDLYCFDKNGVMQKCVVYTASYGEKFLYGNDGKYIKFNEANAIKEVWASDAITTKSNTDNPAVKLDDSHMMDISQVNSNGKIVNEKGIKATKDKSLSKAEVKGKTLYCRAKQTIELGTIKVSGTDADSSLLPKLIISFKSSDESIAYSGIDMSSKDGFFREIHPRILVYKPGNTTVTIDVNGTQTSFDIVVSE